MATVQMPGFTMPRGSQSRLAPRRDDGMQPMPSYPMSPWNTPMGYNAPGNPLNGGVSPLYGGFATQVNVGQVGGSIMAPGAQEARYRQAYAAAQQANQQRYSDILGGGSGVPIGQDSQGNPLVQINGRWIPQSQATPQQINAGVAQNSMFQPAVGGYYGRYARGMAGVDNMQGIEQGYGQRAARGNQGVQQLQNMAGDYDQRFERNMGYIDQMGQQERKDLETDFKARERSAAADLASRGFSNSTILPNVRASVQRDRDSAIGRLNDRLAQQRLSADSQLSGDTLRYREGIGRLGIATDAQLSGDQLRYMDDRARMGIATDAQLSGDMLRFMENREDIYPDPNLRLRMQGM